MVTFGCRDVNLDLQLGFTFSVQPNLQQMPKVADLMDGDPIGIVVVMRAVVSGANDVENVVAVELPIHILETGQLNGLLMR